MPPKRAKTWIRLSKEADFTMLALLSELGCYYMGRGYARTNDSASADKAIARLRNQGHQVERSQAPTSDKLNAHSAFIVSQSVDAPPRRLVI